MEARDAALLAVGWAAALRRSELVGLDWQKLGGGSGFLRLDDRGVVITLMASKASQDQAETIVVPCADMPAACQALETWADVGALQPGQPVFRPIDQRQIIGDERLTDRSVARIVKDRVRKLVRLQGRSETEADELVALVSGHSLRAGYATSAAACNHARLPHPAAHAPQVGTNGRRLHSRGRQVDQEWIEGRGVLSEYVAGNSGEGKAKTSATYTRSRRARAACASMKACFFDEDDEG